MWFDDIRQWTMLKDYGEVKRRADDRVARKIVTRQPFSHSLLKLTHDDDDDDENNNTIACNVFCLIQRL